MHALWAEEEIAGVNLEDERLSKRMGKILSSLGKGPSKSIPSACNGYSETKAAYRFFANKKVDFESIIEPHSESTKSRMEECPVVLLVQDTTEIDLTKPTQQVEGAGYLDGVRRGVLLHAQHAFMPDGTPLGSIDAEILRKAGKKPNSRRRKGYKKQPIERKESYRWLSGLRTAQEVSEELPNTQCICVADSECDIYEVLSESPENVKRVDWIVRACQNRKLVEEKNGRTRLYDEALKSRVLFEKELTVRARRGTKISCENRKRRQARKARTSTFEVRATTVTLSPPHRNDRSLPSTTANAVLVREVKPPKGEDPIEWLLLTTLPISKAADVKKIVEYYTTRWMIEILFKTLKSGCRAQQRQFEHIDRFESCLAIYLIIAWRSLYVCRFARSSPQLSCEAIFEPQEWKAVYMVVKQKRPPKTAPRLMKMLKMVAELGGYIDQKDKSPGPQTTWLGLQRTHDLALGWMTFGPGAKK